MTDQERLGRSDSPESRFLTFDRVQIQDRVTPIVRVVARSSGVELGRIAWFGRWRQFCFFPRPDTVFNTGCMADIRAQIGVLMRERQDAKRAEAQQVTSARVELRPGVGATASQLTPRGQNG